jgi:D-ribose pyranose/furanose isomerase RbsD
MAIHLTSISATFFTNLLSRLGVKPPPADGFDLINTVQPVSLVDSDIVLPVSGSSQLLDLPFTAGKQTAPGLGTVLADTLAQGVGSYQLFVQLSVDGLISAPADLEIARRNAANNADLWVMMAPVGGGTELTLSWNIQVRVQLQANERIVVRVGAGNVAASVIVLANIWLTAG